MFIELHKWGSFDMPYSDSVWVKENETQIGLAELINKFWKQKGVKKYNLDTCGQGWMTRSDEKTIHPNNLVEEFKNLLKENGWRKINTVPVGFSD